MSRQTGKRFVAPNTRILIVDDDPMNLLIEKNLLKPTKMIIDTAESGEMTLLKVKEQEYDLILLDHMMPGMDGIETLQKLNEEHLVDGIPVLVLTSNDEKGARQMYEAFGFQDYLKKPIMGIDLEDAILKWLPEQKIERIFPSEDETVLNPKSSINDALSKMIQLKKAMSYSDDNIEVLYDHILLYLNSKKRYMTQLSQAYEANDINNYMITIHALKGSSMLIGAIKISCYALEIESECKKSNWKYVKLNHKEFLNEYVQFCNGLQEVMSHVKSNAGTDEMMEYSVKDCLFRILAAAKVWDMVEVGEELVRLDTICSNLQLAPSMLLAKQQMIRAYEELDYDLFTASSNELLVQSFQLQI